MAWLVFLDKNIFLRESASLSYSPLAYHVALYIKARQSLTRERSAHGCPLTAWRTRPCRVGGRAPAFHVCHL